MTVTPPRGIAVVDVGYTNTKVMLFSPKLELLAERKMPSPHHQGPHYGEIDVEPMLAFFARGLAELDAILPVDTIVSCAHGACIVSIKADGTPAVPIMDYMSEPPKHILADYTRQSPTYAETFSPQLPVALLHAMQLFWQQQVLPEAFAETVAILPLMQYVAMRLGGKVVTEISAMGCQSHLLDLTTLGPSSLAISQGWAQKFASRAKAWDRIGTLKPDMRGTSFRGRGDILAGVHDSNANYLRYLAAGIGDFTLLSTGTWIIGFDTKADIRTLDHSRDIVANVDVLGHVVACSRFFGGKEFEIISAGSNHQPSLASVQHLIDHAIYAIPTFTDSGGPMSGTAGKGHITGDVKTEHRTSLASLYCALMVSESLDAIQSKGTVIVDGPFSQNKVFLSILASLRPAQSIKASNLKDGTAAGAACLALMPAQTPNTLLPHVDIDMAQSTPANLTGLITYQQNWRKRSIDHV